MRTKIRQSDSGFTLFDQEASKTFQQTTFVVIDDLCVNEVLAYSPMHAINQLLLFFTINARRSR